jgi:hypothetical protein
MLFPADRSSMARRTAREDDWCDPYGLVTICGAACLVMAHRVSSLRCTSAVANGGRADRGGSQRPPRRQPGPRERLRPAEVIRTRYQMKRTPVALKKIRGINSHTKHLSRWRYSAP